MMLFVFLKSEVGVLPQHLVLEEIGDGGVGICLEREAVHRGGHVLLEHVLVVDGGGGEGERRYEDVVGARQGERSVVVVALRREVGAVRAVQHGEEVADGVVVFHEARAFHAQRAVALHDEG